MKLEERTYFILCDSVCFSGDGKF